MTSPTPDPYGDPAATADGVRQLALAWYRRARTAQIAHAHSAAQARTLFLLLGVPAVLLGVFAGSAVAADAFEDRRVVIGLASLLAALLTALQTFLRLDDKRLAHEIASRRFGVIRRELGEVGAIGVADLPASVQRLSVIRTDYDDVSVGSPQVSQGIWESQKAADRSYSPDEFGAWPGLP
ncbi:SLATT domain-containing protein [Dermatophilaceae bacterium Soc4.6]